jgi:hypothetical protein
VVSAIKLTIHGTGVGTCPLTGEEGDGLTVTFEEGTVKEAFLSWKEFRQLLGLKTVQPKPEARPTGNRATPAVPVNPK